MNVQFRSSITGIISAAIMVAGLALCAITASAQPLPWNPPCASATVYNRTTCPARFKLATTPPATVPGILVAACASVVVPTPPPGLLINGVFSQAGTLVPMISPGPIPPAVGGCPLPPFSPTVPADGWVPGVVLGPAPGCCFDVYFYRTADPMNPCSIWLFPSSGPCTP